MRVSDGDSKQDEKEFQALTDKLDWLLEPRNFSDKPVRYLCAVLERVSNWHIQGYIECREKLNIKRLKERILECNEAHIEFARGDSKENRDYIFHEGKHAEKEGYFERPTEWGKRSEGQGHRTDIEACVDQIKKGATVADLIDSAVVDTYVKYKRAMDEIKREITAPRELEQNPDVIVYYGETGSGKSHAAHELAKSQGSPYWTKTMPGNWFDGYKGEKLIILEEFKGDSKGDIPIGLLLQMLDRWPCRLPIKGSSVECQANKFIICSNVHPKYWYKDESYNQGQLKRRITAITKFERIDMDDHEWAAEDVKRTDI